MSTTAAPSSISDPELEQIEGTNATSATPVVFT
jgi:hypothetical protein